jgi:hypothetical protein
MRNLGVRTKAQFPTPVSASITARELVSIMPVLSSMSAGK